MRCSSTVSAPVQHCCAPLTAHHSRYLAVQLLNNKVLYFIAETKSKAKDVYAQTCIYLAEEGMLDCELFGLAIMCDGEYLFVDPECKLSKYAPKNWKSSSSHGLDGHGKPVFVLHFRVQFYVDTPILLRDNLTRHNYYLQLRDNAISRDQISFCSSDELLLLLGGYALQADYGDYNEAKHQKSYFQLDKYFPKDLINRNSHIFKTAVALHKDNHGLSSAEAELQYIKEASSTEINPLSLNVHLYRLKSHKKQEMDQTVVWLAICARGIQIYEETQFRKSLSTTFLWNNIGKLCFDRKKFEIKALSTSAEKLTYYTSSDDKSKHLLFLCKVTHQFHMAVQSRLLEVKKKEEEDRRKCRNGFSYNNGITSEYPSMGKSNFNSSNYKNMRSDQRISVISNTSSNTTSGIVSDRVQSLDESEDDLEMEIMINSPPGNSVESLALAHLRDGAPVEDNESSDPSLSVSGDAALFVRQCTQKSSPSSGGDAATPATTDGSQCSSSCSTVIVAGTSSKSSGVNVSLSSAKLHTNSRRRSSTSSSLELGYSHTAENSVVSDSISCLELDASIQNAQFTISEKIESESSKSLEIYNLKSMIKNRTDLKTSHYLFSCANDVGTNIKFSANIIENNLDETRGEIYGRNNAKICKVYEKGVQSDLENTHRSERIYSGRTVSHLGNGSDLETTSSGIYTTSNDLESNRIYSPTDLENASSGIFTLRSGTEPDLQTNTGSSETSGVYLANSIADTSSASECCGVYAVMESMRERSGSNASGVSASGSFHGDGSDPSEAGKGSLLTAEELSDLIVGKAHNSGSYPSRASISNTLDSDSDYVTLPPPPRPPRRVDNGFDIAMPVSERPPPPPPPLPKSLQRNYLESEKSIALQRLTPLKQESGSHQYSDGHQRRLPDIPRQPRPISFSEFPPQQFSSSLTSLLAQMRPSPTLPSPTEEANARFITTKPHISMITHSNVPPVSVATPNYASRSNSNYSFNYCDSNRLQNENSLYSSASSDAYYKQQVQNSGLHLSSSDSLSSSLHQMSLFQKPNYPKTDNSSGFTRQNFSPTPNSIKRYHNKNNHPDPGSKMKLTSLPVVPVVGKNNYLDVHASKANGIFPAKSLSYHRGFLPLSPQAGIFRQHPPPPPPPPPPPTLATVYTSQVTRSQIEQFKQQLYSDVDYVIYPMKDPAISKQEYIDAKQGSLLAAMANGYQQLYPPPPPYPSAKTHVVYRSTPNVAVGNGYFPVNFSNQPIANIYSSNTHLSQSSEQLYAYQKYLPQPSHYSSTSPLYSAASYSSSSSQSLRYDPMQITDYFIPQPLSSIPGNSLSFSRTRSDDNILNTYQTSTKSPLDGIRCRRFPPPPPPPPYETTQRSKFTFESNLYVKSDPQAKAADSGNSCHSELSEKAKKEEIKSQPALSSPSPSSSFSKKTMITDDKGKIIDINTLIEKSKNLDLPLISALCNDKSLIRQTNAFVMPKHPVVGRCSSGHGTKNVKSPAKKIVEKERPSSFHAEPKNATTIEKTKKIYSDFAEPLGNVSVSSKTKQPTLFETLFSGKTSKKYASSSKFKYPVSGLSTTQISKPKRKLSSAHVHPKNSKPAIPSVSEDLAKSKSAVSIKNKNALVP